VNTAQLRLVSKAFGQIADAQAHMDEQAAFELADGYEYRFRRLADELDAEVRRRIAEALEDLGAGPNE
jgi:hypothetical protein